MWSERSLIWSKMRIHPVTTQRCICGRISSRNAGQAGVIQQERKEGPGSVLVR